MQLSQKKITLVWMVMCWLGGYIEGICAADGQDSREKIRRLQGEISQERQKIQDLIQASEALESTVGALQKDLVQATEKVRESEVSLSEKEDKWKAFIEREKSTLNEQSLKMKTINHVSLMLYRLSKMQSWWGILSRGCEAPHASVQALCVIKSLGPYLHHVTQKLRQDWTDTHHMKKELSEERMMMAHKLEDLKDKQKKLNEILDKKSDLNKKNREQQRERERRVQWLGEQAQTLQDLLIDLEAENVTTRQRSHKNRHQVLSFKQPVHGKVDQGFRPPSHWGVTYQTKKRMLVISPERGYVVFSGPFLHYKHLLIIEHGQGYHSLFSGIAESHVSVGQSVAKGQSLGMMPAHDHRLYVEMRQNGRAINPVPLWK